MQEPEKYHCHPTDYTPNSDLPVLVYRNVLPKRLTESTAADALRANDWVKGGKFKHISNSHYHSNTHECYAAISGHTKCRYGVGPLDNNEAGIEFELNAGDIVVHAAGVAHCNVESSDDYEYIGAYPKGSPHWNNNYCQDAPGMTRSKASEARSVPIPPSDPIYGRNGPLPRLWRAAAASSD